MLCLPVADLHCCWSSRQLAPGSPLPLREGLTACVPLSLRAKEGWKDASSSGCMFCWHLGVIVPAEGVVGAALTGRSLLMVSGDRPHAPPQPRLHQVKLCTLKVQQLWEHQEARKASSPAG